MKMQKSMNPEKALNKCYRRIDQLRKQLASIDLILPGSIYKRMIHKEDPKASGSLKTIGPYYQWTWKKKGKTVTINLTEEQARKYQKAIDTQRTLTRIIKELRMLSLQVLENTTNSVKRKTIKKVEF